MTTRAASDVRSPRIELVVTDLDGTLWERPSELHPRVGAALDELDVPLLVATGRRVGSARAALAAIGLAPSAVVLNGGLGVHLDTGGRFHVGGFEPSDAADVLAAFSSCGVEPVVHVDHDDRPVRVGAAPSTHPLHLASFGDDVARDELDRVVAEEHVLAFGVLGLDAARAERLQVALAGVVANAHIDRDRLHGGFVATAVAADQSKWDGVRAFCAEQGIDDDAVLAIGDGANDVELLASAAVAVTPADAHPDARRHADHVVGRAADGGWAELLDLL